MDALTGKDAVRLGKRRARSLQYLDEGALADQKEGLRVWRSVEGEGSDGGDVGNVLGWRMSQSGREQ